MAAALVAVVLAGGGHNTQGGSCMDSIIVVDGVFQMVQEQVWWCGDDYGHYGYTRV